ncbi:MAG: AMP-binding protein [Oligoflexia bacterium]|nr:AMP-binding protein [Oligoflexia bacterium]
MSSLSEIITSSLQKYNDRPAIWVDDCVYTYGDLSYYINQIRNVLHQQLTSPALKGERICIWAYRSIDAYVGILSGVLSGMPYVPLNPRFPDERNLSIINRVRPKAIIVDKNCEDAASKILPTIKFPLLVFFPSYTQKPKWCSLIKQHQFFSQEELISYPLASISNLEVGSVVNTDSSDMLYILFTSGSTGEPKGVVVSHGNVFSYVNGINTISDCHYDDRYLQHIDLTFDLSAHDMYCSWCSGASLYVTPHNLILFPNRFISEYKINKCMLVPSTAGVIQGHNLLFPNSMPSLKYTFFCGEPLTGSVVNGWQKSAPSSIIYNVYGPTEATIAFTYYKCTGDSVDRCLPIGKPLINQQVIITSSSETAADEIGEILLGGSQVALGYWENEKMTDEKFYSHSGKRWYKTGDLGKLDPNSQDIIFLGRSDRQIKVRGFRVELGEIESVIRKIAKTYFVAVLGDSDSEYENVLGGEGYLNVVALVANSQESKENIIEECKKILPDYMVPSQVIFLKEFPRNSNDKIDYKEITKIYYKNKNSSSISAHNNVI